jgi:rubredoxin
MFFICKQCGVEFEGHKGETHRVFCSRKCYEDYKGDLRKDSCPYNEGVGCSDRYSCFKCGWNPNVEKKRKVAQMYG